MRRGRLLHGVARTVLVMVMTAAGAAAGGFLGTAYVSVAMPDAGLEALGPMIIGSVIGCVLGAFVELAMLFKVPRLQREYAAALGVASLLLLAAGFLGYLGLSGGPAEPAWATIAISGLPLCLMVSIATASSLLYGRP